jgi:uncharacterized protein (TIGR00369 family)
VTTPKMPPPCFAFLQSELVEASGGKAIVLFRPTEQMENPYGIIQGGILAAMLDNTIGPALWSIVPDRRSSTIQMSINFLRPVKAGEVIRGVAEVVKHGQTQAYIETRLERASDGAVLTKATATNVFLRG